ncbi:MAG: nucleotidyltransferase domain-containing protein [Bacteroidales bacterium]|nr:nucleotidyltransferase domain-containing protein [Bacteroidales bacterium]
MKISEQNIFELLRKTANSVVPSDGKAILFGSRARGDNRDDSDWDLLVIFNKDKLTWEDKNKISDAFYDLELQTGQLMIPIIHTKKFWEQTKHTIFHKEVERDGIVL